MRIKKVMIDARYLCNGGGIDKFISPLIRSLEETGKFEFTYLLYEGETLLNITGKQLFLPRPTKTLELLKINIFEIRSLVRKEDVDLYYSPYYDALVWGKNFESVATIHDFAFFDLRISYPLSVRVYFIFALMVQFLVCKRILFISNYQLNIFSRYAPSAWIKKIRLVKNYFDYNAEQKSTRTERPLFERTAVPTVLYTGGFEKRKNLVVLFEMFKYAREKYGAQCVTTGRHENVLPFLGNKQHLAEGVEFLGYVSDERIGTLYEESTVIVQPSVSEGFGRTIAEAIYHGKPVICYDLPVYREFFEDVPLYAKSLEQFKMKLDFALSNRESFYCKVPNSYPTKKEQIEVMLDVFS